MAKNKTLAAIAGLKDSPEWEEFKKLAKADGTQAGFFKKMLSSIKGEPVYTCPNCKVKKVIKHIFNAVQCDNCSCKCYIEDGSGGHWFKD